MDDTKSNQYHIVFHGEIQPGVSAEDVKHKLAQALKASPVAVEKLFSGRKVFLKKNISLENAEKIVQHLTRLGAIAHTEPAEIALELSLDDVEVVEKSTSTSIQHTPSPAKIPSRANPRPPVEIETKDRRPLFSVFSLQIAIGGFILLIALIMLGVFFPWPDGVVRRGFLAGAIMALFGYKLFRSGLSWER